MKKILFVLLTGVFGCADSQKNPEVIVCNHPNPGKMPIADISLDHCASFGELQRRIQEAVCKDSLTSLNFISGGDDYRVQTTSVCESDYTRFCPKHRNYMEIVEDSVFKNDLYFPLDSLGSLLQRDYLNNGLDPAFSESPEKFFISAVFLADDSISEVRDVLANIAAAYEQLKTKEGLVILLGEKYLPPPEDPNRVLD